MVISIMGSTRIPVSATHEADTPKRRSKHPLGNPRFWSPAVGRPSLTRWLSPNGGSIVDGIENVIISLCAKGISNSDIEEADP